MFYQIFPSPQVKRWAIITNKHGIYELPHELLNELGLRILGNQEISGNCLNPIELLPSAQLPRQNETSPTVGYPTRKPEPAPNIPRATADQLEHAELRCPPPPPPTGNTHPSKFFTENQNYQFKLKIGTQTNLNVQKSIVVAFTLSAFVWKYFLGGADLVKKSKFSI